MVPESGSPKPALVAGASGFVGSHTARLLCRRGRTVRVLVRPTSRLDALADLPVEIHRGDVLDPESLRRALSGVGTVFYSVVDPRFWLTDPTPLWRNNVTGLVHAMEAALEAGVERFVFTSTMGTLGQNPGGLVDEEIPFNWLDRASPYIRARLEAENRFFQYCRERGLPGVALCVANTYGPEDYQPTPHNGMLWLVGSGKVRWALAGAAPTVDIRDVAEAALLAETRGRIGERYIIANEYLDNRELYALAAQALGNRPPRMVPRSLAYAVAWLAERILPLFGVRDFLLTTDAVYLAHAFGPMDTAKARRELGWNPRPMRETVADAMAWFAARQGSP